MKKAHKQFALALIFILFILGGLVVFFELVYVPPPRRNVVKQSGGKEKEEEGKTSEISEKDRYDEEERKINAPFQPIVLPEEQTLYVETEEEREEKEEKEMELKEAEKEAILLIHGAQGSTALWKHILATGWPAQERKRYQIVMPSLLGHGNSPAPLSIRYSVKEHVDSLVDVLRRYVPCGRKLHIVGISLGGPLSIALSARLIRTLAPWPIHSLTLVAAAYFPSLDRATVLKDLRPHLNFPLPNTTYILGRYILPKFRFILDALTIRYYRKLLPTSEYFEQTMRDAVATNVNALLSSFESILVRYDVNAGLKTLRDVNLPILVIDGSEDKIYETDPERASLMGNLCADAKRVVIEGGTHIFCIEYPKEFVAEVLAFIKNK